jgi:spore germination cell wall hydrolase CwlJ-like protein
VAVAIVIGPGRAGAEAASADAGLVGYVFELAVAQVVIERVAAVAGDVNILQAVVVVIGYGYAHAPAFAREARGLGYVGELARCSAVDRYPDDRA